MLPRMILASAIGCLLLGSAADGGQESKLDELGKLRRERRKKEAEAQALKKEGGDESQKKAQPLQGGIEALGKSIAKMLPEVIQPLLKDLKGGTPEVVALATSRLAAVGTPAVSELETLAKSGTPDEQKRAQVVLKLIADVEAGDSGLWSQWAADASASSAFQMRGDEDGWSPRQACGKPDTEDAGDLATAWTSKTKDKGEEWLELIYLNPVRPTRVRIHETFNPGAVVKIEAQDPEKKFQVLWEGKDPSKDAPVYLDVQFDPPAYATTVIRVTLDTKSVPGWNQIDAVQLIGEPTGEAVTLPEIAKPEVDKPPMGRPGSPKEDKADSDTSKEPPPGPPPPKVIVSKAEAIKVAVQELLQLQKETGLWDYERPSDGGENGAIWAGIETGGTAIVAEALLFTAPEDKAAQAAVQKGIGFLLGWLEKKKMEALTKITYDYRIWGHCLILQLFCYVRARKAAGEHEAAVNDWIPKLVEIIRKEEHKGGGWNYAGAGSACFVTAPVLQSLLVARQHGEIVPEELFERGRAALIKNRLKDGGYYYGPKGGWNGGGLPGSPGRMAVSEATLFLLGAGSPEKLQFAIDTFYQNWGHFEKRRKKRGTHAGKYGIASYYYYFAHRYLAQVIELLPEEKRAQERERMFMTMLATRDEDGTWNDRPYPRSRVVGTAYALMILLAENAPVLPKLETLPKPPPTPEEPKEDEPKKDEPKKDE